MKRLRTWFASASDMRRWHRWVGIGAAVVLLAVSISGVMLSTVPVLNAVSPEAQTLEPETLASLMFRLEQQGLNVEKITVTAAQKVVVEHRQGNQVQRDYVEVKTGRILAPVTVSNFYQQLKSFHRSLWMGDVGRYIVAVAALAMLVLSVSGVALLVKRQGGWRGLLLPAQGRGLARWHSLFGQVLLIPLVMMASTAIYLALDTFDWLPTQDDRVLYPESREPLTPVPASSLASFQSLSLQQVESILYPIADDWFDVYTVKTHQGYVFFDQFTGELLSRQQYSSSLQLKHWMLLLHSGEGVPVWAIVLGISASAIPFFAISGAVLWWRKPSQKTTLTNNQPEQADAVILVGSETQTTWQFAHQLWSALASAGFKVHQADLNSFQTYPKASWVFVLTATYGEGNAPSNAQHFIRKTHSQTAVNWQHAVVGFGDQTYQQFCQFAQDVGTALQRISQPLLPLHTVDKQSEQQFKHWGATLEATMNARFDWTNTKVTDITLHERAMTVMDKQVSADGTVVRLKLACEQSFQPGDLLAIRPKAEHRIRLYSVASCPKQGYLELVIKKVEGGVCSSFLHQLKVGDTVQARVQSNPHFQVPHTATRLVCIATGTGIAPFAGIIAQNREGRACTLLFGCRHPAQDHLFEQDINQWCHDGRLSRVEVAFSRTTQPRYVQDLLVEQAAMVLDELRQGAVIMVCGSQAMAKGVAQQLNQILADSDLDATTSTLQLEQRFITEAYG